MKRFFNTAGPCRPDKHYMVPASARLGDVHHLIEQESYFVVHAPRQTGKTTSLRALARELTEAGRYAALHFSCEAGEAAGDDYGAAELTVLDAIERAAGIDLAPGLRPPARGEAAPGQRLGALLTAWAQACPRPLVLVFDEVDALQGQSLLTVLRQLRAGFPSRPGAFPSSVILCGLRDVRDYKAASGGDATRLGTSSPFNVKVESIKLGNFDLHEVQGLLLQHQRESGQVIDPEALARVWELTGGQPWLVNALAREVVEKIGVPPCEPITSAYVDQAKERLILARQTHLDSLVAKLMEPRVRRVMAPLIAGETLGGDTFDDDYLYVRDLGLVSSDKPVRVANPIYREVLVRVLANAAEANVTVEPRSFVRADGTLDLRKMLEEFAAFWREHGEILAGKMPYHEVAPQLVFMAFLQRVVNGGGYVDREYGVGRGRIDLLVRWPVVGADRRLPDVALAKSGVRPRTWQREALELKVWADGKPDPLKKGLEQLDGYLAGLGLDRGVLVLFDRRAKAVRVERRTKLGSAITPGGRAVTLLRA